MRAWRVEDFGIAPNWLGSISSKTTGRTPLLTRTEPELGRRVWYAWWWWSHVFQVFHQWWNVSILPRPRKLMLGEWRVKNIADRGSWKASIFPKGQLLIPSGPPAFLGFSSKRTLKTSDRLIVKISEFLENGGRHASGLETCIGSRRAVLIIFAVSRLERTAIPSRWRYEQMSSPPVAWAIPAIITTSFHHWLGSVVLR